MGLRQQIKQKLDEACKKKLAEKKEKMIADKGQYSSMTSTGVKDSVEEVDMDDEDE